jgi:hypothetical protein
MQIKNINPALVLVKENAELGTKVAELESKLIAEEKTLRILSETLLVSDKTIETLRAKILEQDKQFLKEQKRLRQQLVEAINREATLQFKVAELKWELKRIKEDR